MLRTEQKSEGLINTLANNYTQIGDLVFDPSAGFYSTERPSMSVADHRQCIMEKKIPDCEQHSMVKLAEVFERPILMTNLTSL